jgi:hypothetical protein
VSEAGELGDFAQTIVQALAVSRIADCKTLMAKALPGDARDTLLYLATRPGLWLYTGELTAAWIGAASDQDKRDYFGDGSGCSMLFNAAAHGDRQQVAALIEAGASMESHDPMPDGQYESASALGIAILRDNARGARMLIEAGAPLMDVLLERSGNKIDALTACRRKQSSNLGGIEKELCERLAFEFARDTPKNHVVNPKGLRL